MEKTSLYDAVVALGIEHDSHESDLYIPVTRETRALIEQHYFKGVSTFRNNLNGDIWYDVPFAYAPWWRKRGCTA